MRASLRRRRREEKRLARREGGEAAPAQAGAAGHEPTGVVGAVKGVAGGVAGVVGGFVRGLRGEPQNPPAAGKKEPPAS